MGRRIHQFFTLCFSITFGLVPESMHSILQGAAGATNPPSVRAGAKPGNETAASGAGLSDVQIERDLKARLSRSKLSANRFQIRVQGGIATIDGKTEVVQHKGIMTRMAKAAGARAVVNRIEVSEAAKQRAGQHLRESRRRAEVKRTSPPIPAAR